MSEEMKAALNFFLNALKTEFTKQIVMNIREEIEEKLKLKKEYYSLKEVSFITGLAVGAIKGRYRRGSLKVVYDGITPLIPACEVERLLMRLKKQKR